MSTSKDYNIPKILLKKKKGNIEYSNEKTGLFILFILFGCERKKEKSSHNYAARNVSRANFSACINNGKPLPCLSFPSPQITKNGTMPAELVLAKRNNYRNFYIPS